MQCSKFKNIPWEGKSQNAKQKQKLIIVSVTVDSQCHCFVKGSLEVPSLLDLYVSIENWQKVRSSRISWSHKVVLHARLPMNLTKET